jgi:hypothetical protein
VTGLVVRFVVQFAILYALLIWVASDKLPIYVWIERGLVAFVDLTLQLVAQADALRELSLDLTRTPPAYRLHVELGDRVQTLGGPMRMHGFVPLLFVALVIATPRLTLRRRGISLLIGGALCSLLAAGMLMNYVQTIERRAFAGRSQGPYPAWIGFVEGLQRTAAGGLIPVIVWGFFASGPLLQARAGPGPGAGPG